MLGDHIWSLVIARITVVLRKSMISEGSGHHPALSDLSVETALLRRIYIDGCSFRVCDYVTRQMYL